jgi:hypothetical protein
MPGEITLSVELELGWGSHMSSNYSRYSSRRTKESHYLEKLLAVCDEHDIPITFNLVGKLISERHLEEQDADFYPDGWWDDYKSADADLARLFYAPDLIRAILDAEVDHELATHTLSHIMVDEVSPECFRYELEEVQKIYDEWGIEQPISFVAPRHRQFDPDVLADQNIRVVRVPDPDQPSPNSIISLWMLTRKHPIREPEVKDGLLYTFSSSYPSLTYSGVLPKGQLESDPQFQYIPVKLRQYLQQRYLRDGVQRAAKQDSNAHFWTHLWDMSNEAQWKPIKAFIKWLGEQSASSGIDLRRMGDLSG